MQSVIFFFFKKLKNETKISLRQKDDIFSGAEFKKYKKMDKSQINFKLS